MTTTIHDPAFIREQLVRFMARERERGKPWTQSHVGKAIGRSPALISAFLHNEARGDVQALCTLLVSFLEQQEAKQKAGEWTLPYVQIRQAEIARECLDWASIHGEICALIGDSGKGKSTAIREFRRQHPRTVLIEACRIHGPSAILQDLCVEIGESDKGLLRGLLKRIVHKLKESQRLIIIDDAHTLGFAALDVLRTVHDRTGVGMVLAGITLLEHRLVGVSPETEQLARRVVFRRKLPEFLDADAEQQLHGMLPHLDAAEVLGLFDPRPKSSPARVANVCKLAGKLAGGIEKVTVGHIRTALRQVA